jgi:hypothetical protein
MRRRGWIGTAFLFLAASIAAGCGGGGGHGGSSPVPGASAGAGAAAVSCGIELPTSGVATLCVPENAGIAGTLSFTVAGLPSGVTAQIEPSSANEEPQAVRRRIASATARRIASATALQKWAINIADTASGANATITGPSVALTGVAGASSVDVELLDQKGNFSVFTYSELSSTTTVSTYLPAQTGGESAAQLMASCFDQDTTCFLAVVSGSIFQPIGVPTSEATSTPAPGTATAPATIPTTGPPSGSLSNVIVTSSDDTNELALTGATPAPAFPLNGGTITWGSPAGEALFLLHGSADSAVNIKYWGGLAPHGCPPPAQTGGSETVKAVVFSAEFSGWNGTGFEWGFEPGNLFTTTPLISGVAPNGIYYGLIAAEGQCGTEEVVNANGAPANGSPFILGEPANPVPVNESETYVLEIWYQ